MNLSPLDRSLRIALGLAMLAVGWSGTVDGVWGLVLQVFGWVPLATGIVGWCPVYAIFGVSTRRRGRRTLPGARPG